MPFGIMNHLAVIVCKDAQEAIDDNHIYRKKDGYTFVEIEKAVVVQNGTKQGNATVDLVLKDEQGNKFVVLITGNLLKSIPC